MTELKNKFEEIIDIIDDDIVPGLQSMGKTNTRVKLKTSFINKLMTLLGENADTLEDAIKVIEVKVNEVRTVSKTILENLENDYFDLGNKNLVSKLKQTQSSYMAVCLGVSDILSTAFDEIIDIVPGRRKILQEEVKFVASIFSIIEEVDVIREFKGIPNDVPETVMDNLLPNKHYLLLTSFRGNPLYSLGKYFNRREKKRRELIKARLEYVRLEMLQLESKGKVNKKTIEYYKNLKEELENELELD